ncbi:hypothetical protein CR513_10403, partial [Mucuna pruriens]
MKHTFLEKFFPASRTTTIRKEICGIRQHTGETLHEYWESMIDAAVIIANNLTKEQEDKLLEVLSQHKKAIGWKLSDLPGINPSICMHRILMEEDIKPIRQ